MARDKGSRGAEGGADAVAQNPGGVDAAERAVAESGDPEDIQFFEGSVAKINRDGQEVISDHLAPGETLRRETTDTYTYREGDKRQAE